MLHTPYSPNTYLYDMKTAEEIIQDMVEEMPFYMHERAKPYIYEAMKAYAKQVAEQALKDAAGRLNPSAITYKRVITSTPIQTP